MRARVHSTARPLWAAPGLALPGPLLLALTLALGPVLPMDKFLQFTLGGVLALLLPLLTPRRRPDVVDLLLSPGAVVAGQLLYHDRWIRLFRLQTRDVRAIRVARGAEGVSLWIERANGELLFLELEDEASATAVRAALLPDGDREDEELSVQARSFAFQGATRGSLFDVFETASRAIGLALWPFYYYWAVIARSSDLKSIFGVSALICVAVTLFCQLVRRPSFGPRVTLGREGIKVGRTLEFPYHRIDDARLTAQGLEIFVYDVDSPVPSPLRLELPSLSAAERAHLLTHVLTAARAARGRPPEEPAPPPSLSALLRAPGEPARVWLLRLDALGQEREGDPYRKVDLDVPALWATLEDPSAPQDARAAAARVLNAREPVEVRRRIEALRKTSPAEEARRIRIAVEEDVDEASLAYEDLPPPFRALARKTARAD